MDPRGLAGRRVAGRVIRDGAPFRGADVRLEGAREEAGVAPPLRATTDEAGRFDFGTIPAGVWVVIAEAPGMTGDAERVDLRNPREDPAPDRLLLELRACRAALFGIVRDASGGVVASARVRHAGGPIAFSDAEGRYELCSEPGFAAIVAEADGYGAVVARASVYGRERLDLSLLPEATVSGVVLRAPDEQPLADALVQIVGTERDDGVATRSAVTDENGAFRIAGVAAGRVRAQAVGDGWITPDPVELTVEAGHTVSDLVIHVEAAYDVSGRVVDDGRPVAGARVSGVPEGDEGSHAEAITQDDGGFRLRRLPPGDVALWVVGHELVSPKKVRLERRDLEGVTVEVDALASISGRVLARGQPVDGARVWIAGVGGRTESGHDGRYELIGLKPGDHKIYAESLAAGAYTRDVLVRVAARERKTGVDISLDLVGSISGVVVEEDGTPVPGVHVRFSLVDGNDYGFATTASDGTFTAGALSGGGEYAVDVRPRPRSDVPLPPADGGVFPHVFVADGTSRVTGVRLVVELGKLEIAGRVLSTSGEPVPDVKVQASPYDAEMGDRAFVPTWMDLPTGITDADGAFTVTGLMPGAYILLARSPGGARATVRDVSAGSTNVRIELTEPSGVDGTLVGFGDERVSVTAFGGAALDFREFQAQVDGDTFALRGLTPGTYTLGARGGAAADVTAVTVRPGEIAHVTLTNRGSATVEGRVVDLRSGAGVPDASCSVLPTLREHERPLYGGRGRGSVTTDAEGRFTVAAPAGPGMLVCGGARGAWFHETRALSLARGEVKQLTLRVVPMPGQPEEADLGMVLVPDGARVAVAFVAPDGAAMEAGVQTGDVVVSIDGIELDGVSFPAVYSLLVFRAPGSRAALVLDRNGERVEAAVTARQGEAE
jgi:uncharacterized GH25 family protein